MFSPSKQQQQKESLFPVHSSLHHSSSRPSSVPSMIRRSTEFSRECSASSVVSTTTKLQLVGGNRPRRDDLDTSNLALNLPYGNCAILSDPCPLRPPPPLLGVSLLHASDKVTVLPASNPPSSTGEVRNIPIKAGLMEANNTINSLSLP